MKKIALLLITVMVSSAFSSDYFPLSVGNTWILDILDSTGKLIGTDSAIIGKDTSISHIAFFPFYESENKNTTGPNPPIYLFTEGNNIFMKSSIDQIDTTKTKWVQHDYHEGDQWVFITGDTCFATYYGRVSVPAGSFDSCFFIRIGRSDSSGWVYAPNIGIVKSISNKKDAYLLRRYTINAKTSIENKMLPDQNRMEKVKIRANNSFSRVYISFRSQYAAPFKVTIYALNGAKVLESNHIEANCFEWNTLNSPRGTYIIDVIDGKSSYSKQCTLIK